MVRAENNLGKLGVLWGRLWVIAMVGVGTAGVGRAEEEKDLGEERKQVMLRKLEATILPSVRFEKVEIGEVLEELETLSKRFDPWAAGNERSGVRLEWGGEKLGEAAVTMEMRRMPLIEAMRLVAERSGTKFRVDGEGAVFEEAEEGELEILELQVPPSFSWMDFSPEARGPIDPFAPARVKAIPRKTGASLRESLLHLGVELADGDSAYLERGLLRVRSSAENLIQLQEAIVGVQQRANPMLRISLSLFEMSAVDALDLVRRSLRDSAAGKEFEMAMAMVSAGRAELLSGAALATRSGQRSKVDSGSPVIYVYDYRAEGGKDVPQRDLLLLGTTLEVDPVIRNDGVTVDINLAADVLVGEPEIVKRKIAGPATGRELEVEDIFRDTRRLNTALTTLSGQTQLIGSLPSPRQGGSTVVAFLTVAITRALPEKRGDDE